ncbi:hypothetical protein M8J75_005844 [Diaphorina citri]|nr:hypothetical protein M8J75_005844 [Diaphorina citri]
MDINITKDDGKKEVSSDLGKEVSSDPKAVSKESVKTADNQSHADSNNKAEGQKDKPKKAMSKKKGQNCSQVQVWQLVLGRLCQTSV